MTELKLRGYVTPEDFDGDVQKALDMAEELDIRKVILEKDYVNQEPLTVPAGTHLVLLGTLTAELHSRKLCNYSFEQDRFFIEGGKLVGNIYLYNTRRAVLQDLTVEGSVRFEYSRDMRMERCWVRENVYVGRGCANGIFQGLEVGGFALSGRVFCGDIVPAKEPDIKNILLRDSVLTEGSVVLTAAEGVRLLNIQADHVTAPQVAVVIGEEEVALPPESYFNLTFTDLTAPEKLVAFNEAKHAYISL